MVGSITNGPNRSVTRFLRDCRAGWLRHQVPPRTTIPVVIWKPLPGTVRALPHRYSRLATRIASAAFNPPHERGTVRAAQD